MLPDLSGLSAQEAALITDVLSQLSIGSAPTAAIVPQSTPVNGDTEYAAIMGLDLAVWTIEQELRGLQNQCTQGSQPERLTQGSNGYTNLPLEGTVASWEGYPLDGAPQTPQNPYKTDTGHGRWPYMMESRAQPLASDAPPSVQPSRPNTAGMPQQVHQIDMQAHAVVPATMRPEELGANSSSFREASLGSPAPAPQSQRTSLLKEMRERLRQQQTQRLASEALTESVASRVSSINGSTVDAAGQKSYAVQHSDVVSTSGASPASTAGTRIRKAAPSVPGSTQKAFTMLNARTSTGRYGPEPGQGEAQVLNPTKPPVKLPEPERSVRLQQLYERTAQWRRRCEERYAKERQDRETSELVACTFTPKISTASHLIMQGKSPSEAYLALSKGSTPTKHCRDLTAVDTRPSTSATTSSHTTPVRSAGGDATGNGSPVMATHPLAGSRAWSTARGASAEASVQEEMSGITSESLSPSRALVNGAEVGERLYQRALEQRARQEARIFQHLLEEERQRRFTASVQSVSPRVYDPPEAPVSRHLPSGMEECTFHPSSPSGWKSRPKSAPHMRGAEVRPNSLTSPLFHIYGPPGHENYSSRGQASSFNNFAIGPDLDWEEFLARQDRFLFLREQKIALLEQAGPVGPRMCPGSKKLLREKELRQSTVVAESSTAVQGELSTRTENSSSPPQDRRARTIMEMYKECTFQPQITRKAAALPGRQLDDFVDGGRARREEWRQQQQALREMREAEDLTFKPLIFTKDAYSHIKPRISLKNPDAYLALVADKRRQREALRAELDHERKSRELQQCTFKPQTTPLPAYLIRRLQEQHLEQLRADQGITWEESSGGLGDIDSDITKAPDAYYVDTTHESPLDVTMSAGGLAPEDQVNDAQDAKTIAFRDAYQRALQYAASMGRSAA